MRVLAHIHTRNDADIIDRTIEAVRRQTRAVDGILVVDNASTDGTLERAAVRDVTILRHPENCGTSGAVYSGLGFALEHDYDWTWVFDADSVPEPDALEKLLGLYAGWPQEQQEQTAFLACLYSDVQDGVPQHGGQFTADGIDQVRPEPEAPYYACHFVIWSGCLYRMAAVRQIGLPNPDYMLDWGEGEYGYRVMQAGFQGFIHQGAILHHNIRGKSFNLLKGRLGPLTITILEAPPIRCYYGCRNMLYFLLYESGQRHPRLVVRTILGVARQTAGYLLRPRNHGEQIIACCRGFWHGLTGNIAARY
jgi:rhamnopyranosyl-N-acetylglucosaminyl-diphospho-decaprenol beta-1,3/1,4-galactofuranosyltransferase